MQPSSPGRTSPTDMESACRLVTLPAIDGRQYVYLAYAPADALPADLFRQAWHCHDEGPFPRAWDVFDAAVIRRVTGRPDRRLDRQLDRQLG